MNEPAFEKVVMSVLIFATMVFAINTFDVISLFFGIAQDLHEDVGSLGLISATLVIGIGVFQIPSGIIAAKYGPKRTAMIGMIIIASGAILVGMSTDINQIAIFRFILGGGLAFYFPSALVLAAQFFRKGSEGLAMGSLTGANAAGGVIGLIVWVLLAGLYGWRTSIVFGGILALVATAALLFLLPKGSRPVAAADRIFTIKAAQIRRLLLDKSLIIFGVLLLGSQIALEQTLAFMPFYLQSSLNIAGFVAGLVGSFTLLGALVGAPLIGWLYDRKISFMKLIVIFSSILVVGMSLNFANNLATAMLSTLMVGFAGGGLFALFSNAGRGSVVARAAKGGHPIEYSTLSVNWIHCIALTGTFWAPLLFSLSAAQSGFPVAWPLIGLVSFGIIIGTALAGYRKHIIIKKPIAPS